jgi:hypothetical protein
MKTDYPSESDCKKREQHLILDELHKKLILCDFHSRCKIRPYYHNFDIKFIGGKYISKDLASNNSYLLMDGRMGNGDDRVRYKLRGSTIVMIKYSTDDNEQEFLCSIPSSWIGLNIEQLRIEVDKFIENRKVFKKVVNTTSTISYVEV